MTGASAHVLAEESGHSRAGGGYVRQKRPHSPIFSARPKRIWLVSFTDFMSLMVAFFVMLYASGDTEVKKFKEVSSSMNESLSVVKRPESRSFPGPEGQMGASDTISLEKVRYKAGKDIKYLADVLEGKRHSVPELAGLKTRIVGDALLVSLPLSDLLDPARDVPTLASRVVARELAGLLTGMNNRTELSVDWTGNDIAGMMGALLRGQKIYGILHGSGLSADVSVLVEAKPLPRADAPLSVTLRLTRFR